MSYTPLGISYGHTGDTPAPIKSVSHQPYALGSDVYCPVCGQVSIEKCKCSIGSHTCPAGHQWYYKDNKIVMGTGHDVPQQVPYDIKVDDMCYQCQHYVFVKMSPSDIWNKSPNLFSARQIVDMYNRIGKSPPQHFMH